MTTDFDVVVLGYGPVGHVMAALLAQDGWRVGVVERNGSWAWECQKPGALRRELECLVAEASPPPLWSGISQADQPAKGKQAAPGF